MDSEGKSGNTHGGELHHWNSPGQFKTILTILITHNIFNMKLFRIIKNWFKLLIMRFQMNKISLNLAIRKAKKLNERTGLRYRVFFFGSKYHVWNRRDIRGKQSQGLLKWNKKAGADFDQICFYDTNKPHNT